MKVPCYICNKPSVDARDMTITGLPDIRGWCEDEFHKKQVNDSCDRFYAQMHTMANTTQDPRDEELARLRERDLAQQARIAQMRDGLLHYSDIRPDTPSRTVVLSEEGAIARKALATTDDLSALKAHDDALWNEALTTGIEWQATRGHTLDADDYGNELRSLKR